MSISTVATGLEKPLAKIDRTYNCKKNKNEAHGVDCVTDKKS
jgi:hypothetical protein